MLRALLRYALIAALPLAALAQQPPGLEPLPEPPPSPGAEADQARASARIAPRTGDHIEESRIDGKRSVKVTTPAGTEYHLRDDPSVPQAGRRDSQNPGVRVPLWVIKEFE